jgi:glutamate-1-semialdehyde 2,1-aminomutase
VELNDLDRRIWDEELEDFVPDRIFDVHSHVYRWAFNTDPGKEATAASGFIGKDFPEAGTEALDACDRILMPRREVNRLSFPFPFSPCCDFTAANDFVIKQSKQRPGSGALMLVHPSMTADFLETEVERRGFLGFKPYRLYSATGDTVECKITDFLPETHIQVADRRGLILMMHLSKRNAIADPDNINDLVSLSERYPGAKWILAHCARSYSAWAIEKAAPRLRALPNVWFDTSTVCESDSFDALCSGVGVERLMYGSDDLPVGVMRGKYITFGFAWAYLSETNHSLRLEHADPRMTFVRYEMLRAMRRTAQRLGLTKEQIRMWFCGTALSLVKSVRQRAST